MKRVFIIFVLTLLFSTLVAQPMKWDGSVATAFNSGTGDIDNPYLITTPPELAYLSAQVNNGINYQGKYFRLENNLDLDNKNWIPIGGSGANRFFKGFFDGNGKTISNLSISLMKYDVGLFGWINAGGELKNLGIIGSGAIEAYAAVGSICGTLQSGKILNCYNVGSTVGTLNGGNDNGLGGIVGAASGSSLIDNCYNTKNIIPKDKWAAAGGIVGSISAVTVSNCYFSGMITVSGNKIGAIYGLNSGVSNNNYYDRDVYLTNTNNSGISKTTVEMKSADIVTLLGVGYIQDISGTTNNGYPILTWQTPVKEYTVTIENPTHGSIVVKQGTDGIVTGSKVTEGSKLSLKANADANYVFSEWWDGNREKERTVVVNSDITISATFETMPVGDITVTIGEHVNGNIIIRNGGSETVNTAVSVPYGTLLTIEAVALEGYRFKKWSDNNGNRIFTHEVTAAITMSAMFELIPLQPDVWTGTNASSFGGGAGLETNPYYIDNSEQLAYLAQQVNSGNSYANTHFKLTYSLDLNRIDWIPIGDGKSFLGIFDGNGNTIANVYFYRGTSFDQGLFGVVENGEIKNLGIVGNSQFIAQYSVGSICGNLKSGKISNCFNASVDVRSTSTYYDSSAGGIVGTVGNGVIENCYNASNVNAAIASAVHGGIVGYLDNGTVKNCFNVGKVSAGSGANGIVGHVVNSAATFSNNYYDSMVCPGMGATGAIAKTTDEMKSADILTSLGSAYKADFSGGKKVNEGYPILQWQKEPKMFKITIVKPEHGDLSVFVGDVQISSGDEVQYGTTITLSTIPLSNYKLGTYLVNGEAYSSNKYIVKGNTTISATLIEKQGITVEISNTTHTYDKTNKTITYTTIPSGMTCNVVYKLNNEVVNEAINAGSYNVILTRVEDATYASLSQTTVMTINKADITGITFENMEYTQDGTQKSLFISGTLPEGTSVSYENNTATEVGVYNAKATIRGSNYNTLVLEATLTITTNPTIIVTVSNLSHVFDGTKKQVAYTTEPSDMVLTVTYKQNGIVVEPINTGSYDVLLTREADATYATVNQMAIMTITPATITGLTFNDQSYVYDGTEHEITVTGELPIDALIKYENNKGTSVGVYNATTTITAANYTQLELSATLTINKATPEILSPPEASPVGVGYALSSSVLSGGNATTVGIFRWTNGNQTVHQTSQFEATFVPSDIDNYNTIIVEVEVKVAPVYTITVATCVNGSVSIQNSQSNNKYVEGEEIMLIASPNGGYRLVKWWNDACGSPYIHTVSADVQISATFEKVPEMPIAWDGTIATSFGAGDGTEGNPYLIYTANELAYLAQTVNAGTYYMDKFFLLKNDLNLNNREWTPIGGGKQRVPFTGTFDGNGKTIANLSINQPTNDYIGLFGIVAAYSTIKNLGIVGSGVIKGYVNVGSIVGFLSGNVSCCYNAGSTVSGNYNVGGLVGTSGDRTTIDNCYNRSSVSASGSDFVAGIVSAIGYTAASVVNCYSSCSITGSRRGVVTAGSAVGVTNCYYDHQVMAGIASYGAIGLSTADMKNAASQLSNKYKSDFSGPQVNDGYPILNYQLQYPSTTIEKLNITVGTPINGNITVKNGSTAVTGTVIVETGTVFTLTAQPNPTYVFVKWWDNNTNPTREFTAMSNTTINAIFESKPPTNHIITIVAATNGSIVVKNGNIVVNSGDSILEGSTLQLTAEPDAGYRFIRWWDNNVSASRNIVVADAMTISAEFELIPLNSYEITITVPTNGSIVVKDGSTIIKTGDIINEGTVLTLTAVSNTGYEFVRWWDNNTSEQRTVTVTSDLTITAIFASLENKFVVTVIPPEHGSIIVKNGQTVLESGATVIAGTILTLTAIADADYELSKWWDNNTDIERMITVSSDVTISALFRETDGVSDLPTIDCSVYAYGKSINITMSEAIKTKIQVVDIAGRICHQSVFEGVQHSVEMTVQGVYIVRVITPNNEIKIQKVVIR